MLETYVFLDKNNIVVNSVVFEDDAATDDAITAVKRALRATTAVKCGPANPNNSVAAIPNVFGAYSIGNEWDGVDTFRPQKPEGNYILNIDNTDWVEVPQ